MCIRDSTCTVVEKHKDDLIIFIIFHRPDFGDFIFCKFISAVLIRISVLVLNDINERRIIFVADVIF